MSNTEYTRVVALNNTWLKQQNVQADALPADKKLAISKGRILYARVLQSGASSAQLQLDTGGLWWAYRPHWLLPVTPEPGVQVIATETASAWELDPRGSEEAGLIGPKIKAVMKANDTYILVNDRDQDAEAYTCTGKLLWRKPALARGQGRDNQWTATGTDTPPGLYKLGTVYRDYETNQPPVCTDNAMAYGWYSFDMIDLEGQEARSFRAGIMLHGGGSACGWPGAWNAHQNLHPTLGCIRMTNADLRDYVLPLYEKGTVYVGVFQEP